jgi:2-oxo-hept-3-ene-1,7-dioate hydratase
MREDLEQSDIPSLAAALEAARVSRRQIRQFSRRFPGMSIGEAYAIQRDWLGLRLGNGDRIIGHKIGLTSRSMQLASGISEPDFAPLLESMDYTGRDLTTDDFILPRVEIELAFILARPLSGAGVTVAQVLDATAYVAPAIEIIDARIEQVDQEARTPRTVVDTISDFAACAGVILGTKLVNAGQLDLRWISAILAKNGVVEETGVAAGVLGHPAHGVAWLTKKLGEFGEELAAGEIVLSGSFIRPVAAANGDRFEADFGALGKIAFAFV